MKKFILINGLIRNEDIFLKQLDIYDKLKNNNIIDEIYLVIDKNKLCDGNNIPLGETLNIELKKKIEKKLKIYEIENLSIEEIKKIDPLCDKRCRNELRKNTICGLSLWRPMYSLKKGLEFIEDNSFVYKTRPDMLVSYNLLEKIFTKYIIKLDNDLLEYKIWSSGFNEKELLYIMDFTFAGKKEDLLKTCHMNGEFLLWGKKSPTGVNNYNTLWWIDIFYKKYPIIKKYYETYVNEKTEIKTYKEDLYLECINLYYNILDKYFIIDSGLNEYSILQSWGHHHIFNSNDGINIPNSGRTEFKNSSWLINNIIKSYVIDYENTKTDLCILGEKYGTDKSPYNKKNFIHGGIGHRHPYTCIYYSFFNNIRYNKLKIIEVGVLLGDSIKMFNEYFQNSTIIGVDKSNNAKDTIEKLNNCIFDNINVQKKEEIIKTFDKYGPFDIILDDASHKFNDQINIIEIAIKYLKKDGYLIIEDIFENKDIFMKYNNEIYADMSYFSEEQKKEAEDISIENLYNLKIRNLKLNYKNIRFYSLKHNNTYTPDWNNNKILVLQK